MRMIYGSLWLVNADQANQQGLAETEKQKVAGMLAALDTYPWDARSLRSLPGKFGCCALGIHTCAEKPSSNAIPSSGDLSITADVRLDNRAELCTALGINTGDRAALDDAGLILMAYQKWGTDCPTHLLGDFAFVIWDESAGRLFCVRDFVGARPFYYHLAADSGRFVFASDLLAMAAHPDVPMQLNLPYVLASLQTTAGQFQHPEHTYYRKIEKLKPAHSLILDAGGLHCWEYWQPGQTPERRYADEQEYVEELRTLLQEAVACRVRGSYPVGAHISGGLDSSSIAVLAHRILRKEGRAFAGFSWAPDLPENLADLLPNDERKLVEAVRAAEGMLVRYTNLTPAHLLAYARRDITLQPTTTLQYELAASAQVANRGISTLLSGWGGDELVAFNGRGYFSDLLRRGHWLTLQREFTLRRRIHGGSLRNLWIDRAILPLLPSALLRLLSPGDYPAPPALPDYLRPDLSAVLTGVQPLDETDISERPGVRRMQIALLQHGHLSYRMEAWASHGATLGIAYAYPLLDRRMVEFALSIPDHFYFKNGWKRYLYRVAMQGILPDSLRWNKTKEDPAMVMGANELRAPELNAQLRVQFLARKDNPFVDVEKMLAEIDALSSGNPAANTDNKLPAQTRHVKVRVGQGRWLAYVNPRAQLSKEKPA